MVKVRVEASGSYDVLIGAGLLKDAGQYIREVTGARRLVLVSDNIVHARYGETLKTSLQGCGFEVPEFVFPNGERQKNLHTYGELLEFLCAEDVSRSDAVVALGGGVVGDLAGFAAATYRRGIGYVQIPTTLLAAVDSSVGGKTAVDLVNGKNQAGAFCQPLLVLCDTDLLKTLPEDQYRAGCAEIIKYSMIGREGFYKELFDTPVRDQLTHVISTCVEMKRDVVQRDEFDTGERMLLNFGHTFGHSAEVLSNFSILHGQGVAMGMAAITRAAVRNGVCSPETYRSLAAILDRYGLPTEIPYPKDHVVRAALTDKKRDGSDIRIVLPERVGHCVIERIPASRLSDWL